jgi:hypothetical protein
MWPKTPATVSVTDRYPAQAIEPPIASSNLDREAYESDMSRFKGNLASCEDPAQAAEQVAGSLDHFEGYRAVHAASASCATAANSIAEFEFSPSLPEAPRKALSDMKATCQMYIWARAGHLDQIAKVLNGEVTPKAVDDAMTAKAAVDRGAQDCAVAMVQSSAAAGFDALAAPKS